MDTSKKLTWIGSSLKDLKKFPEPVKDEVGYSLHKVQSGHMPKNAKLLKGIKPVPWKLYPTTIQTHIAQSTRLKLMM